MIFDYLKYMSLYKIVDNKKNPYIIFKYFIYLFKLINKVIDKLVLKDNIFIKLN